MSLVPKKRVFATFWRDQSGATAIEYGLIASLVVVATLGVLITFGAKSTAMFALIANKFH